MVFERLSSLLVQDLTTRGTGTEGPQPSPTMGGELAVIEFGKQHCGENPGECSTSCAGVRTTSTLTNSDAIEGIE